MSYVPGDIVNIRLITHYPDESTEEDSLIHIKDPWFGGKTQGWTLCSMDYTTFRKRYGRHVTVTKRPATCFQCVARVQP